MSRSFPAAPIVRSTTYEHVASDCDHRWRSDTISCSHMITARDRKRKPMSTPRTNAQVAGRQTRSVPSARETRRREAIDGSGSQTRQPREKMIAEGERGKPQLKTTGGIRTTARPRASAGWGLLQIRKKERKKESRPHLGACSRFSRWRSELSCSAVLNSPIGAVHRTALWKKSGGRRL